MVRAKNDPAGSYQVALPGVFGPTYLAAFEDMGVSHTSTTSVFLLSVPESQGVRDITAMLHARGLVILGIRRLNHPPGLTPQG